MSEGEGMAQKKSPVEEALPAAGEGRWWKVEHKPANRANPIRVSLMESMTPGRKSLSRVIGWEHTIASAKAIGEAADLVLARVGDYALVVGEYGDFDGR